MGFSIGTEVAITNKNSERHGQIGEIVHIDNDHDGHRHHVQFEDGGVDWFDPWDMQEVPE